MTYNIRYDNPGDGINQWDNRKQELSHLITYYKPDVLGIQEGLLHQLQYLDTQLMDYSRIGVGRDDGVTKGEFSAIYYNHHKLSLIQDFTFWLSETPDTVSVGWDASMERICTYGLFQDKTTMQKLWIFNTHFDHIGERAREESSKLILKKINDLNTEDFPVILMGDFNSEPDSQAIKTLTDWFVDASKTIDNGKYGPEGTFTGFTENAIPERRIDYIFVKNLGVAAYRHIDDKMPNNQYLSDHLPVIVQLK
ncbi:endonuclease/exonuclease/phosphatase [Hanstruepera neustonica]|uniref:Endonuclease/exonuclease/phosphatase n=2 Tax=Hanstruepera neustonica TaxID=1445657 RepID=A0A2K1DW24_9FLAO|nr:endonuclease/exonuclease/phosphatase [Hanstruepera neustonica]